MTIGTVAAGIFITVVTIGLELLDKDYQRERAEFEK